ncbi:glycosyltransferase family 9 protein [Desulfoplanes formicivorans]|nr:glycosyltransferase family 9 protein [Desulfoplanes formicivorans]
MKPILVIQMQRMGDLIMTFPLLLWLERRYPGREIIVVAEPRFYRDLAPLGPAVRYVSLSDLQLILDREYSLVINVSHRRQGAFLAGKVRAEEIIGPYLDLENRLYIRGDWQLYRASLVECNRHNTFHWAELNALDVIPLADVGATLWPEPRRLPLGNARVGIFLGASQDEKRPVASFWIGLAQGLLARGMRPILLGGPAEQDLGNRVARGLGMPVLNLAGKTSLDQFARIGQTLQIMITPDTGPMHLAAWTGLRTLNLSMGPVNPWETGPYQKGHYILRTSMSCSGCWSCRFGVPRCTQTFDPDKIVRLVVEVIRHREHNLAKMTFPGLELMRSARHLGGFWLDALAPGPEDPSARQALDRFWHGVWKWHFKACDEEQARGAAAGLVQAFPVLVKTMRARLVSLCRVVATHGGRTSGQGDDLLVSSAMPCLSPCVSFARLILENGNFARSSYLSVLTLLERILSLLE